MPCVNQYLDAHGNPSLLHPELELAYGVQEAVRLFQASEEAVKNGIFGSQRLRTNGEPTLAQVVAAMKAGILSQPNGAMVNATYLVELQDKIQASIVRLEARLKHYESAKGGSGLTVKDETVRRLRETLFELKNKQTEDAYISLVEYAGKQLQEYHDFLATKFDAAKTVSTNGENRHSAALSEIALQLKTFEGVLSPEFAQRDTRLKEILDGAHGVVGLNRLRDDVQQLVNEKTEDLLEELLDQKSNREGLTRDELREHIKAGKDILLVTRAMGGLSTSGIKLLSAAYTVAAEARLRADALSETFNQEVIAKTAALKKAGIKDFVFMSPLDANGKTASQYIQKIAKSYYHLRAQVKQKVSDAGDYILGQNLTAAEKAHNIARWQAGTASREFHQSEVISDTGQVRDGDHHRFTQEFKDARDQFQELRQNGKYWGWEKKAGVDDIAYRQFLAKYYSDEREVRTMIKDKSGNPTGEIKISSIRFTKSVATEVREDVHRDPTYAKLIADSTRNEAGRAKLDYYEFFVSHLQDFANRLPQEDAKHLLRGELPAIKASVTTQYNSKQKGFLDWAGQLVTNPLQALKGLTPAAMAGQAGVRTREDGSLFQDVPMFFTGRFKDVDKIDKLTKELKQLDPASATYEADKKRLTTALTIEQNRIARTEGETDLSAILMAFGKMATSYEQLKEQEGTMNAIKHAVANRTYYKESGGELVLKNGQPIPLENHAPEALAQYETWLTQNFYQDYNVDQGSIGQWAKAFQQYTSITFQGLNFTAALRNLGVGNLNNRVVAAGKQFGWDKKVANAAFAFVGKDILNIAADRMSDHLDRSTYTLRPRQSIVDAIMTSFNFLQHNNGLDEVKTGSKLDALYIGVSSGEYHIQSQTAIAKLMSTKVVGLDGQESSVLDALSLANGALRIDPNYAAAIDQMRSRLVLDVRNINKRIHGNYAEDDKVALQKHWLTNLLLQFKKWLYNGVKARWGREQFDEGIGVNQKGYYRSLSALFQSLAAVGLKMEAYHTLSELEKANLRMVAQEVKYAAVLLGVSLLALSLKPGPDDEDKKIQIWCTNLLIRTMDGIRGEITGYADPLNAYQTAKNPMAALTVVRDLGLFLKNLASVPLYVAMGEPEKLNYQTGVYKGESKLLKSTMDLIPILRMRRSFMQLQQTATVWVK